MLSARQISKSSSASTPFFDWLVEMAEVRGGRKNSPPSCNLGVLVFSFLTSLIAFFRHWQDGLGTWQSCTPGYIQPQHPLWRHPWPEPRGGINWWWWACAYDLMCLYISCHSFFNVYHFAAYWIYLNVFRSWTKKKKKHDILIQVEFWVTFLCFRCHGTCQLSLSAFSTCLSPTARQWLWHRVAEASERVGDAGCFGSRGWGFASCTSTVQPGNPDPATASFSL